MTRRSIDRQEGPERGGAARVAHNSFFLIGSQVISKLAGFTGVILMARFLGVDDFGLYSLALAVTGIVALVSELGLNQLSIREIARDPAAVRRLVANTLPIKILLSLLALAVTALTVQVIDLPQQGKAVLMIMTLTLIPAGALNSLLSAFMGLERMGQVALLGAATEFVRLALAAAILFSGYLLVPLAWSYAAATTLALVAAYILLRIQAGPLMGRPDAAVMKALARESVPFMFFGLFFLIYFKIDFIMLAALRGEEAIGTYAAAYRLMESLIFLPAALMGAVFPGLSRLSSRGDGSVLSAANRTLRYLAMIGIPIGFGVTILAGRIIPFLFGDAYAASVVLLQIVIWALVLIFLNCICPVGLNSTNRQMLSVVVTGAGIAVNVLLNLALIPLYGAAGASISTVITEVFVTALFLWFFSRNVGRLEFFPALWRPGAAALLMAAGLLLLSPLPLGFLIAAGVVVYLLGLIGFRALVRSDFEFAVSLLRPAYSRNQVSQGS